mgnify:CR=1 FL=1
MNLIELYEREIDNRYIPNLMRAANMNEQTAEDRIRELFPIMRAVS